MGIHISVWPFLPPYLTNTDRLPKGVEIDFLDTIS